MAGRIGRMPTYARARAIGEPAVDGIRSHDSQVANAIAPRYGPRRSKRSSWPPTRHRRGHPVGCVIVRRSRRSGVTTTSAYLPDHLSMAYSGRS
jgi:hypothetical protein